MPGVVLCVPHHRKRVYFRFAWIGPGCMQDLMDLLDVTIDQRFQGKARRGRNDPIGFVRFLVCLGVCGMLQEISGLLVTTRSDEPRVLKSRLDGPWPQLVATNTL